MNANLTIDTLAFNQTFTGKDGSERREVSRGVNLPEVMSVRHTATVDKKTGKSTVQSQLRFDRYMLSADGVTILPVRAVLTVYVPQDTGVVSSDVLAVVQRIVTTVQEDDTGLDLADEIFVNREQ
jgi:hypothetical protein